MDKQYAFPGFWRKTFAALGLYALTTIFSVQSQDFTSGKWLDLTHEFNEQSIYWPTAEPFKKTTVFEGQTPGGFYYSAYNFAAAEHGGTHLDSPVHFYQGQQSVEQIPLEQLIGPAVVIDISSKTAQNRDYQLTVADIQAWEAKQGKIPDGSILLVNTGFARYYGDQKKYMGTVKRGEQGVKELSFPGIHPKAAEFIASKRKIKAVGLDTPSLDYGKSTQFQSHVTLFSHNIPGFENVANLNSLPATGATVVALPMKIKGGSGGPLRIVAFVPNR
ncbi:cyclase family protein [Thalassomonas sp. RHCl1]|uniref:cyclase family protein n=1 Tax=Thalassomonas sp. RHCl1 TaxID=2995320 RepID=UPI00248ABFB7|nr:cyclase family protein [Thalassomonas sp. RHCl1]